MKFYILASQQKDCKKQLDKMVKLLTYKPSIKFSKVEKKLKTTKTALKDEDGITETTSKYIVEVVEVEIEDLAVKEWRLVASVYFQEGVVMLGDSRYFGQMPKQFGLDYFKCDFCGSVRNRKESYVLYNTITGEWKQVGSDCVNKVINGGKKLAKFVCNLYEYFKVTLGACGEDEDFNSWRIPDHSRSQAISVDEAICLCDAYRKEFGTTWVKRKGQYDLGTNDHLRNYYFNSHDKIVIDADLCKKVRAHVAALKGDFDWDGEPDFNQRIKDAFANEYIVLGDIYLAYFALKGYEDKNGRNAFLNKCGELGIVKDGDYAFSGKLVKFKFAEDYYGTSVICTFEGDNGLMFEKSISRLDVLGKYTKEKIEDEFGCIENKSYIGKHYQFKCGIKYIASSREVVGLGGRLSKVK